MAGHSHWAGIKHKKGVADQKRGQLFSKLLNAVSIAARKEQNPQFNPHLRAAIDKARKNNVPQDKIDAAIKRASEAGQNLEELILEAYGPEGAAILIEAITDSKNRTISEIKKILSDYGAKWAESGSVRWAFHQAPIDADKTQTSADEIRADLHNDPRISVLIRWQAKFKQEISEQGKQKLQNLIQTLEEHDDVQEVYSNANQ